MRINHFKKMLVIMGLAVSVSASADIIKKASAHSVKETMDKFEALAKSKGMDIFARVDHTKNAAGVDMKMNEAEVLIFGNPKGGTVIMKKDPAVSLDLPLKVAVYKDDAGKVWLSYRNPQDLAKDYDVADVPVLGKVETGLDKLTTAVTK
ncbi:DUF302 domain-containing protein [Cocleimonas flava]|jgi:uncharacterized protein (DUF302 family)|uniref:Uncharacterized protein (DUF302 family) n=1 Tax=Cocleimonas flava TaxID=634765 RepID=A0A4R1F8S4_9GAMM|nr:MULTISPECIES: DUF302 domain-containing protein [Cocleimonas]MEB8431493.1 DUF302 domain-containing protein [Cocleimonas sp. KMM 6892]MEC4713735.1 DUF302 domain-containing protein [Cocleimonas sp. KMM 6895]MEC4743066.1 DUF302 domain-containing protein [Cocleimonas sp. KMM 6896]TCJ89172.1 uncharacterized protein (DUF302 family) [Cocleimonas flava]